MNKNIILFFKMASTDLRNVQDNKYANYMTEATHVMDAMRGFGLSMNKIGTAIQQNNLKKTIVKHMVPHVQKHLAEAANKVSQKIQDTAQQASQKLSQMTDEQTQQTQQTQQPQQSQQTGSDQNTQEETDVLEPQ